MFKFCFTLLNFYFLQIKPTITPFQWPALVEKYAYLHTVVFQALEGARAENRLRFTSAVLHHLSAIKIQRALRAHWALESAKRQIHSVVTIQVQ